MWADSFQPKNKMFDAKRPTKYSSNFGTMDPLGATPAKKLPKMAFLGLRRPNIVFAQLQHGLNIAFFKDTLLRFISLTERHKIQKLSNFGKWEFRVTPKKFRQSWAYKIFFETPYLPQMGGDSPQVKNVFVGVHSTVICTGPLGGTPPLRGQTPKVLLPQKILNAIYLSYANFPFGDF